MAFCKNEMGATAIEYALIAGIVSIAIVAAITLLGQNLGGRFSDIVAIFAG